MSHVEEHGKHTFVVTTDQDNMPRLQALRGDISSKLKTDHGIKANSDLAYVERHPNNGPFYQVNLDNLGPVPGVHGEPEHQKDRGRWLGEDQVRERLGNARMPEMSQQQAPDYRVTAAKRRSFEQRVQSRTL
jgi:hypothetical protein